MSALAERLVNRLVTRRAPAADAAPDDESRLSRRGFIGAATLAGAALAVEPWGYLTKPQSAYASVCGGAPNCNDGYSAFCCTINKGHNSCPPGTFPGGWWKADRTSFCGGAARYYIDCNASPGSHWSCHCADEGSCDHRRVACNVFRYGQCNTQIPGVTAVVCRQISCRPPWEIYPGKCGHSSATDQNTATHTAPCLTEANTFPRLRVFPAAPSVLTAHHAIHSGKRLTSPDRHTTLIMHKNGNLAVWNEKGVGWSSHTAPAAKGGYAVLTATGNLMIRDAHHKTVWQTGGASSGTGWRLEVRNSGNVIITNGQVARWGTHTHTP